MESRYINWNEIEKDIVPDLSFLAVKHLLQKAVLSSLNVAQVYCED